MRLQLVGFRMEDEYGAVTIINNIPHKSEIGDSETIGYKNFM